MAVYKFAKYKNISLDDASWGDVLPGDLIKVFESCIKAFYSHQDIKVLPTKSVIIYNVQNDPQSVARNSQDPIWYPGANDRIYLGCTGKEWNKYSYQFSHELCHHTITKSSTIVDNFGWLEESLCELSSIFTLKKVAAEWKVAPPYPNWKSYNKIHEKYADDILNDAACTIAIPFKTWLQAELPSLYLKRDDRIKNKVIAINLFPLFSKNPTLWQCVQYYHLVDCNAKGITTLIDFLNEWNNVLPANLKNRFQTIVNTLI